MNFQKKKKRWLEAEAVINVLACLSVVGERAGTCSEQKSCEARLHLFVPDSHVLNFQSFSFSFFFLPVAVAKQLDFFFFFDRIAEFNSIHIQLGMGIAMLKAVGCWVFTILLALDKHISGVFFN